METEGPMDIEAFLRRHEQKELVRFTTVGSVDDGKSTLIGRLLFDLGAVYDDQLRAVSAASKSRGQGEELDLSLLTDGLLAEREQGITIDVAYRYFSTEKRKYIIADTPGHVEYTRNMATGASTADFAIVLLDARLGVLPQSRRHSALASLLGIRRLIVAVNKMDLVGFDRATYDRLVAEFSAFTSRLAFEGVHFVPVSAKRGDNVVRSSESTPWYDGPTLFDLLETLPTSVDAPETGLRFPVQSVLRPHLDYRAFAGWVAGGTVRPGDAVKILPGGVETRVAAVDGYRGELPMGRAPLSYALRLADEVDASRGQMIVSADSPPVVSTELEVDLVWLSPQRFEPHRKLLAKHTSRWVPVRVAAVSGRRSLETLELDPATGIEMNDIVEVVLRTSRPLFCDPYRKNRMTGSLILVDALTHGTVAAAMIRSAKAADALLGESVGPVTPGERRALLGHQAALVRVASGASLIERGLFHQNVLSAVVTADVSGTAVVHALLAAGVVVLAQDVDDTTFKAWAVPDALAFDARGLPGDVARHIAQRVTGSLESSGSGI